MRGKQLNKQPRGKDQPADKGQRSLATVALNAHSARPGGLLLHSVQRARLFGFSAAGASYFCFSREVGKAAQGRRAEALTFFEIANVLVCLGDPDAITNAIGYAKFFSRSHDAVIRVYDDMLM